MDLTVVNKHSATGKSASALGLTCAPVEKGQRVHTADLAPKFVVMAALRLEAKAALYYPLFREKALKGRVTSVRKSLAIRNAGPVALIVNEHLRREPAPDLVFEHEFQGTTLDICDSIVFDAGSGLLGLQFAEVSYTKGILIPLTMRVLGLLGAWSSIISAQVLRSLHSAEVAVVSLLPALFQRSSDALVSMTTPDATVRLCHLKVLSPIEYDGAVELLPRRRSLWRGLTLDHRRRSHMASTNGLNGFVQGRHLWERSIGYKVS